MNAAAVRGVSGRAGVLLALALAASALHGEVRSDEVAALRTSQQSIGRVLQDQALTDQYGQPLRLAELRGRPLVLSFVFTNCRYVCSGLTLHLRDVVRIARDALGDGRFSVLTVGFDAPRDTPDRMREFASERGIGDPDWHFASADATTIRRLTEEAGFTWMASPAGFDHIAQVTVVDADGRIASQVYGPDFAPPALVEPLERLVLRQSIGRSPLRGLIEQARLWCSVYDPAAGRYRFDYAMVIGLLPGLLILAMVAIAILIASRKTR
jgi:protein SCO1